MDLNQQIAEIDGWTELRSITAILVGRNINGKFGPVPDYLAPENQHELVRVATGISRKESYALGMFYEGSGWRVGFGPAVATHPTDLSHALAEAIIEAKG